MKALVALAAIASSGCASLTLNGQDVARLTATTAIAAIAAAVILAGDEDEADKHSRCPACPPIVPAD